MSARLLLVPLAVEAALAVVVVVLLIAVAIHQSVRERRDRQLASLRRVLAETATDPTTASTAARLRAVPAVAALPTLLSLSTSMSGVTMERVRDLADLAGITEQARAWSVSRLWWRRVRGIRVLTRLGDDSLQLTAMLDDPAPAVRAAAADAVGQRASPAEVARLLGLLDDPDPACRFQRPYWPACGGPSRGRRHRELSRRRCRAAACHRVGHGDGHGGAQVPCRRASAIHPSRPRDPPCRRPSGRRDRRCGIGIGPRRVARRLRP